MDSLKLTIHFVCPIRTLSIVLTFAYVTFSLKQILSFPFAPYKWDLNAYLCFFLDFYYSALLIYKIIEYFVPMYSLIHLFQKVNNCHQIFNKQPMMEKMREKCYHACMQDKMLMGKYFHACSKTMHDGYGVSCVLYSHVFHKKMIKIWDLPCSKENAMQFFHSYGIIPFYK